MDPENSDMDVYCNISNFELTKYKEYSRVFGDGEFRDEEFPA